MANITLDKLKTIVQSIVASVTRYKPNLSVNDPDDPRYVAGTLPAEKLPTIPANKLGSVPAAKVSGLADVAYSGSYNDLSNKPTIPAVPTDIVKTVNGVAPDENGNVDATEVAIDSYTLKIGQPKYAEYGFGILHNGDTLMNYTSQGIYHESTGANISPNSQSTIQTGLNSKKKIVITPETDSDSSECSIALYAGDGNRVKIDASGYVTVSKKVLEFGTKLFPTNLRYIKAPTDDSDAVNKAYVDGKISDSEIILASSTEGSTKKFKITVNDSGTLTATEVTE